MSNIMWWIVTNVSTTVYTLLELQLPPSSIRRHDSKRQLHTQEWRRLVGKHHYNFSHFWCFWCWCFKKSLKEDEQTYSLKWTTRWYGNSTSTLKNAVILQLHELLLDCVCATVSERVASPNGPWRLQPCLRCQTSLVWHQACANRQRKLRRRGWALYSLNEPIFECTIPQAYVVLARIP